MYDVAVGKSQVLEMLSGRPLLTVILLTGRGCCGWCIRCRREFGVFSKFSLRQTMFAVSTPLAIVDRYICLQVGTGTVVGSTVFNQLVIVGGSIMVHTLRDTYQFISCVVAVRWADFH